MSAQNIDDKLSEKVKSSFFSCLRHSPLALLAPVTSAPLVAFAQAGGAAAPAASAVARPSMLEQFFPIILFVCVAYFLFIRPQSKKAKSHQEFLANMKKGDSVVTSSGIWGKIEGMSDKFVTLDVGDGVRLKILKAFISGSAEEKTT